MMSLRLPLAFYDLSTWTIVDIVAVQGLRGPMFPLTRDQKTLHRMLVYIPFVT